LSREGTVRFNELYKLVQDNRASAKCQEVECKLLAFCKAEAGAIMDGNDTQRDQEATSGNVDGMEALPVEAAWDLLHD
jgi:hypothetical protein